MAKWEGNLHVKHAPVEPGDIVYHVQKERYFKVVRVHEGRIDVTDSCGIELGIGSEAIIRWVNPQSMAALFLGLTEPTDKSRAAAREAFTTLSRIALPN